MQQRNAAAGCRSPGNDCRDSYHTEASGSVQIISASSAIVTSAENARAEKQRIVGYSSGGATRC